MVSKQQPGALGGPVLIPCRVGRGVSSTQGKPLGEH